MKKHILLTVGIIGASIAPAQAITFASGKGADSATCGAIASPCRTLKQAVANAPAGGYVVLQDAADFGPATIEKALTVTGENGATIRSNVALHEGVVSILVLAGPNDIVRLRGLTIKTTPPGDKLAGVIWLTGKRLEIEDCHIESTGDGIQVMKRGGAGQFLVTEAIIDAATGVWTGSEQNLTSFYDGVGVSGKAFGIRSGWGTAENARTILLNSSIVGAAEGLKTENAIISSELVARNTIVSSGGSALVPGGAHILLSRSTVTGNSKAMTPPQYSGGALLTFGDNLIRGNGDDTLTGATPTNYQ